MIGRIIVSRILRAFVLLVIVVLFLSYVFGTLAEERLSSQVLEEIGVELRSNPSYPLLSNEEKLEFKTNLINLKRTQYGLDKPFFTRVMQNALNVITLHFGDALVLKSRSGSKSVSAIILEALPRTVILFTTGSLIGILIGLFLGLKAAQKSGTIFDRFISGFAILSRSLPMWWLGMLFIVAFSYHLKIFPSGGYISLPPPSGIRYFLDFLYHLALPLLTVVMVLFGSIAYLSRNLVLGTLQEDYITVARAKGVPEKRVLYGHVLRSTAPPLITLSAVSLFGSFGGALISEIVFNWPGMGRLYWTALEANDHSVLLGNTFVTAFIYIVGIAILDITYGLLDPRIRSGERR